MADEVRIWQIGEGDKLNEIKKSKLDAEQRIENWIAKDITVLSPDLLVIGKQVATDYGKFIDLLCMDENGYLFVVELKRDKTPREVTAQALDYASWVRNLNADDIQDIASKHLNGASLDSAFQNKFGCNLPEAINEHHGMLVVASDIDDSTERIIRYLSETYGVDINAVRFQFFQADEKREFLVRTFTVDPQDLAQNTKRTGTKRTVLTAEEMAQTASKAGVGDLFQNARNTLAQYFSPRNYKTACAFFAKLSSGIRVVFSLVVSESSAEKGLRYQAYSKRLSEALGVDENTLLANLPPNAAAYQYYSNAPDDLKGWTGFIRNDEDIARLQNLLKSAKPS